MLELSNLFSDIQYTEENPAIFKTKEVYKEGNKVKTRIKVESFDLISSDILSELIKGNEMSIPYYQRGIKKLFKKCNVNNIKKELSDLESSNFIIMNSDVFYELGAFLASDVTIDNRLSNEVIVGPKLSKCIININTKEYYIDTSDVTIFKLI